MPSGVRSSAASIYHSRPVGRRFLVTHTGGGLGDLLLSTPVAAALKRRDPGAQVDYWANPRLAPVLEGNPCIDRVWTHDPAGPLRELLAWLRRSAYDVALMPWTTTRQAWLIALADIERRVGPGNRLYYSHLFTDRIPDHAAHGDTRTHMVQLCLEYAEAIECDTRDLSPAIHLSAADRDDADRLLRDRGVGSTDRLCLLHASRGMARAGRTWPIASFVEAGRRLQAELSLRLLVVGTLDECDVAGRLRSGLGADAVDLAGRTTLRQACAVIARCALAVSLDTGPMHLAAAVGVPVVAMFPMACYPTGRWHPYGVPFRIVGTGSWRCSRHCVKELCPSFVCHDAVDPGAVVRAARELLGGQR